MGVRNKSLQSDLKQFTQGKREFHICFDKDTKPKSIIGVNKATIALATKLNQVYIYQWEPLEGKGIDDVLRQSNNPEEKLKQIIDSKEKFSYWINKHLFELTKVSKEIKERFLPNALPDERLIGIKSPQNTGKTEVISQHVQNSLAQGIPCLVVVHRESLARTLGERFGVAYRTENDPTKDYYGFSLCIDSLLPKHNGVNPEYWEDFILIVDEAEQVVSHLLTARTSVDTFRPIILKTLQEMGEKCRQLIFCDADLSDICVEFFEKLLACEAFVINNIYRFEGMNFYKYPSPDSLMTEVFSSLSQDEKLLIVSTSQAPKSKYGTIALENIINKRFPQLKILRIDGESLYDKDHRAYNCMTEINDVVRQYDVVICSPSLETGVSIDVYGHFDKVVGFSSHGNLPPQNFLQMLWRLRDTIDRHFYVPNTGINYVGNASCSPYSLLSTDQKSSQVILHLLNYSETQGTDTIFLDTWSKISARINAGSKSYSETLQHLIKRQGHNLIEVENLANAEIKDEIKENSLECQQQRNIKILISEDITDEQAETLANKKAKTLDEICQLKKNTVKKRYGEINEEILEFDHQGKYSSLRLYYYLTEGRKSLSSEEKIRLKQMLENNDGCYFSPDLNRKLIIHKIWLMEFLDILSLINKVREQGIIRNDDSEVVRIYELCLKHFSELKQFQITTGIQPISTINSILSKIGLRLKQHSRFKSDGSKKTYYYLQELPDWTDLVFEYWSIK